MRTFLDAKRQDINVLIKITIAFCNKNKAKSVRMHSVIHRDFVVRFVHKQHYFIIKALGNGQDWGDLVSHHTLF